LPDTAYDRGKSRANVEEAIAVARAVMDHARTSPDLTLGVAAFSTAQTDAVLDQVERLRREDPSCEAFFSAHPFEPFFVKNLENVQGDERDVIYISVGYGRDTNGHLTMNFGPLNNNGGERRLNVLITRSRLRCEVFTNITGDDIRLNENSPRGLVAFKRFLKYAETGILDVSRESGGDFDSPFEAAVHDAILDLGFAVDKQVGSAGFFIDLAVIDPRRPGRYLLAVECDGATYHSARSARDRDRLRQSVLENLGWQVHRIWSTDWFRHQDREIMRLKGVIDEALAKEPVVELPVPEQIEPTVEREESPSDHQESGGAAYAVARIAPGPSGVALHQVPVGQIAEWVTEIVRVESPVHRSEVARRIADGNGVSRVGSRIRTAVDRAIAAAGQRGTITQRGDLLWDPAMQVPMVRDRSKLPTSSRSIDLIAPEEVDEAVLHVVGTAYGIDLPDVAPAVCRMFGFQRATEGMQSVIHEHIEALVATGRLHQQGIHLVADNS
jgi:very-short-patch-repair endonuclease